MRVRLRAASSAARLRVYSIPVNLTAFVLRHVCFFPILRFQQMLESIAVAVQGITDASPTELSELAQERALTALQAVAGGGTAISSFAAAAATEGLSSVAIAASAAATPAGRRRALLLASRPVEPRTAPPVRRLTGGDTASGSGSRRRGIASVAAILPPVSEAPLRPPPAAAPPRSSVQRLFATTPRVLLSLTPRRVLLNVPPAPSAKPPPSAATKAAAEQQIPQPPSKPPPPPLSASNETRLLPPTRPQPPPALAPAPPEPSVPPLPDTPLPALANLASVVGILDALAASLQSSFSVPGESAAVLTSEAITMISQLDSPAASSRLFSVPLAAPDGRAAFEPLPSDLLLSSTGGGNATAAAGAAAAAGSGGVQTQFLALRFSPHPGVSTDGADVSIAPSVTRLKLMTGDGASEIPIANRTSPIRFRVPAPAPESFAAGSGALCTFWDERAGAFSADGCAALPIRPPPQHAVDWASAQQLVAASLQPPIAAARDASGSTCTASFDAQAVALFNASGAAAAARRLPVSWQIQGPAACGCTATVLNCAAENARAQAAAAAALAQGGDPQAAAAAQRQRIYLSPRDAILFPAVSCEASSSAAMLVFYGALRDTAASAALLASIQYACRRRNIC